MRGSVSTGNHQRKKRRGTSFWRFLEVLCLAVFIVAMGILFVRLARHADRSAEERAAQDALSHLQTAPIALRVHTPEPSTAPAMFAKAEKLLKENPDFVGMVGYGDMSLYVCQSQDNAYYATHRFDGNEDPAGMIYMDCRCSIWPLSDNTILYGHNMRDGSRFGKLNRLTKPSYRHEHPYVRFASLYEMHDYVPVSIFYANVDPASDDYFDFAQPNFPDGQSFDAFVREMNERSILDAPANVSFGDRLLTLATCSEEAYGGRLVVVCKQEK